jgi:hypothetical protein
VVSGSTTANTFSATQITASGTIITAAGTNSAPAIVPTGDTNTGIFFPAADTIAFAEGGAEAMRIDSSGNLGLGVTPSAWGSPFSAFQFGPNGGSINARTDSNQAIEFALNWYYDGSTSRYINSNFATRYRQFAGGHEWYTAPFGTADNAITFTETMRIDSSGNVLVGITTARANAGDVQVSKGISFPATQSAQSDANTLDDYEEGTFTPTAVGGTTTGTTTYTFQYGYYTKIGRQVNLTILVAWSALTGTGNLRIGNLPFTCANLSLYEAVGSCIVGDLNWSGGTQLVTSIASNEAFLSLVGCTDDAGTTAQQCVNESALIRTSITYDV